ncbi:MAG: NGG1p interacting factor NIF3 [Candidatus Peribacteraceae bacterium]
MKLQQFFEKAVDLGIQYDPRGKKLIEKLLKKETEKMKKLSGKERDMYDEERTWNPFPDCRIINGSGTEEFNRIMVGVDIETPEMLLLDRLRAQGQKIDGTLIHHPEGRALADLEKVMPLQVDLLAGVGVPVNQAEGLLGERMSKIWRSIHADNLFRTERAAELLSIPAVCCHTITDNMVWKFMSKHICEKEYDDLGEIVNAIMEIPEYAQYGKKGNPAIIVSGSKSSRPGRIYATEFTGGTNGPEQFFEAKARAGVGTVLSMHATEKALEEAKKHNIHIIQCSHMASDSIGINLMLDEMKKVNPKLHVIPVSGFIRVERKKW